MSDWWLRVPLLNLPLEDAVTVDGVELHPRMDVADAEGQIYSALKNDAPSFVHTADAIVKGTSASPSPTGHEEARDFLAPRIGHLADALRFLYGRDVVGERTFLQRSPHPDATPENEYRLGVAPIVPAGRVIKVEGGRDQLIMRAAACWRDDELDEETALRFAAAFQLYSYIPALPMEHAFVHQWVALETVVNRWCATASPTPPGVRDVNIDRNVIKEHVKPSVKQALQDLVERCILEESDATALAGSIRPIVRPAAKTKLRAFLEHVGVYADLRTWDRKKLNKWVDDTTDVRNALMHGESLTEAFKKCRLKMGKRPDNDLTARWRQSRMLVDRFVMSLIGYEPHHWQFECPSESGGTYRPRSKPPGEGAGATTTTADD